MLTDDVNRLCGEILTMRKVRCQLRSSLADGSRERQKSVQSFCAEIGEARVEQARKSKKDRLNFLHSLARTVNAQRREMRMDLAGARRAWAGKGA
jgi:hypothetical protein